MLEKITNASQDLTNILMQSERNYRVELKLGDGRTEYISLKAKTRKEAENEANEVACIIADAKQCSVLFRLPGNEYKFAGATGKNKVGLKARLKKIIDEFFYVGEDDEHAK